MLKAAVFDDEYIVLQGLQTMIDWSGHGIELCGTATDGHSALALFQALKPDIIFTDIRMPGLDGLQLVEIVLREAPDTYCIVFSGFNEFDYVKRAIQLGVKDYLEKPITIQSIEKAIGKMKNHLHSQQEIKTLQQKWNASKHERLEQATLDLLLAAEEALPKWKDSFGADANRLQGITVLVCTEELVLPANGDFLPVPLRYGQERILVVYHFELPAGGFWDMIEHPSEESMAGIGRTYPAVLLASQSYKEAQKALRSARFLKIKGSLHVEEIGDFLVVPEGLSEREEAIILNIRAGNKAELLEQVDQFIDWLKSEKLDPEIAESQILKLIYLALRAYKENGAADRIAELEKHYLPHIQIREMSAEGRMLDWFREQMKRFANELAESRERVKHVSIEEARAYIESNITRDLTLVEVAEHVNMNPAYLSVLFKEVIGESYIKFLTRCRMELAKKLLGKGLKVNEVSEMVGYHTYRHFSEVFKKFTGQTPGQYKETSGNS
ncbi:response regulator [Paenibacillus sp. FSL E2-0201]|uniref:response regulator transcription factor n=1 Tax=Paenibacillus sp. FSL E2-0201 TaxID=2954726 RepID=UPI0030DC64A5